MSLVIDENAVDRLRNLARGAQAARLEIESKPVRNAQPSCGVDRHSHIFQSGYLAGVCAALATVTGEDSLHLERAIVAEVPEL